MGKRYYDNYDYEEAYKEQCKKLEEAEMERWMKEGWVNCLYRTSTYKSTNTESNITLLESMVYPSFKFKADICLRGRLNGYGENYIIPHAPGL